MKHFLMKNLISLEEVKLLSLWLEIAHRINLDEFDFRQGLNCDSIFYGSPIGDALLLKVQPIIEKKINKKLLATYSSVRLYTKFAELEKHKDRTSCELSATLHISKSGPDWPLFINNEKIDLEPGDALVYDGVNNEHWRDSYNGDYYAQIFLHYVYADGKHKDHYRDKRPAFGINK